MPNMRSLRTSSARAALATSLLVASAAMADTYTVELGAPALDRWNYPFNPTPGTRITASTFGNEPGAPEFDNRDGQFVVGFNTNALVPTGLGASSYTILSCVVTITYANDLVVEYDPTVDPYTAFLAPSDPEYADDADAGQPIELYGTGFRNGFSLATWNETSPFAPSGSNILSPQVRSAFAVGADASGALVDVSNSVRERWTPTPFAVGQIDGLKPGSLVPIDSTLRFTLDLSQPAVRGFLASSLDAGRLRFSISSLTKVVQQGGSFPQFYCRENPIVGATGLGDATLSLVVSTATCEPADLNCDGVVNASDLAILLGSWGGAGAADLNGDGVVGAQDLAVLLGSWG
jgi:hypothetical protein